jgi:hypothetical protein
MIKQENVNTALSLKRKLMSTTNVKLQHNVFTLDFFPVSLLSWMSSHSDDT